MKNYDCNTCIRTDCIHRDCYRRLPTDVGGLNLCPGHVEDTHDENEEAIVKLVESLHEWENILEEAKAEVEAIKDTLKQEMADRDVEELPAGRFIIRWTEVLSNRFDSTAFKKVMPDVYKAYTKQVTSRRFTVSG